MTNIGIPIITAIILTIIVLVLSNGKGFKNIIKEIIIAIIAEIVITIGSNYTTIFGGGGEGETPQPTQIIETEAPVITGAPVDMPVMAENSDFDSYDYITQYLTALTRAVNKNKFSEVEQYLKLNSAAYEEQKDYIQRYTQENSITEVLSSVEILSDKMIDDNTIILETYETYDITSPVRGFRTSTFNTQYTLENINGDWKIAKIYNSNTEQ